MSIAIHCCQAFASQRAGRHAWYGSKINAYWCKMKQMSRTVADKRCRDMHRLNLCKLSSALWRRSRECRQNWQRRGNWRTQLWYSFAPCTFPPGKKRHTRNRWSNAKKALLLDLLKSPRTSAFQLSAAFLGSRSKSSSPRSPSRRPADIPYTIPIETLGKIVANLAGF